MKYLLLFLLPVCGYSQPYFNLEGYLFSKGETTLGGGPLLTFGGLIKPNQNGSVMLGGGAGIILVNESEQLIPVFFELGYANPLARVAPHASVRLGHNFQAASLGDVTIDQGIFANVKAGVSFKLGVVKLIPYVGLSLLKNTKDDHATLFNFGTSLFMWKRKSK